MPAITGYVFFELNKIDFSLINLNPFTKNIVRDIGGKPAIIKNEEIITLKDYFNGKLITCDVNLVRGQRVKINTGPFISKKGTVTKISCNKVVINIDSINIHLILSKSSVVAENKLVVENQMNKKNRIVEGVVI